MPAPDPTAWRTDREALRHWQRVAEESEREVREFQRQYFAEYGESNITWIRIRRDPDYHTVANDWMSAVAMVQMYASLCQVTLLERLVRLEVQIEARSVQKREEGGQSTIQRPNERD